MLCENRTRLVPAPRLDPPLAGARVPNRSSQVPGSVAEYRNQPVVEARFGTLLPFNCAVKLEMLDAAVFAVGGDGVTKDSTLPKLLVTLFSAIAQK